MESLRPVKQDNVSGVVNIHIKAFPDFFLTSLGSSFLKTYYSSVIKHSTGIGVCMTESNRVIGFAVGTSCSNGFHKRILLSNLLQFTYQLFRVFFLKPKSIIRLFSNLEKKTKIDIPPFSAELLSIGVDPSHKGQGVGKILLDAFEKEAREKLSKAVLLTTDYYNNHATIKFYEKCGYSVLCDFIAYPNRKMYKMIKHL